MRRLIVAAALALGAAGLSGSAGATQQGQFVITNWKRMDGCARAAQAAHPDYTAASDAAREEAYRTCLENGNLPPRQPAGAAPR